MEDAIVQIAVQVPAIALIVYFSIRALTLVLDTYGRKIDRLADAVEKLLERKQP